MDMKTSDLFIKQFILTLSDSFNLPWNKVRIRDYNLYYHPELEYESTVTDRFSLYLLGFLFDYEHPEYSNSQILNHISLSDDFNAICEALSKYSGHFVLIYSSESDLRILNDAVAQHEIYYDLSFSAFATQPKLIGTVIPLTPHSDKEAEQFYSSEQFLKHRIFVGESSPYGNIKHLIPNHYIDILKKEIIRFFPNKPLDSISMQESSREARKMLKGYLKAASLRKKIGVGVTGGYDSRVLFLTCLDIDCKYYVTKLPEMDNKHHDLVVPIQLAERFEKELTVIDDLKEPDESADELLNASIDFPRPNKRQRDLADHIIINGNISEIARNDYLYYKEISPEQLAILNRTSSSSHARDEFRNWLEKGSEQIYKNGYNVLDMFYWEERMSHWVAKGKTEMGALGVTVYSPFSSRILLTTLLASPRKCRDYYINRLYKQIIKDFDPEALRIPINPYLKNRIKKILRRAGILYIYKEVSLRRKVKKTFGYYPTKFYKTTL